MGAKTSKATNNAAATANPAKNLNDARKRGHREADGARPARNGGIGDGGLDHGAESRTLLMRVGTGALATYHHENQYPFASMVNFAVDPASGDIFFIVSDLAEHSANMRADKRASLMVTEARSDGSSSKKSDAHGAHAHGHAHGDAAGHAHGHGDAAAAHGHAHGHGDAAAHAHGHGHGAAAPHGHGHGHGAHAAPPADAPADALAKARATYLGDVAFIEKTPELIAAYLERHPAAIAYVNYDDMKMVKFTKIHSVRWISGFGSMSWVGAEAYAESKADPVYANVKKVEFAVNHMNQDHVKDLINLVTFKLGEKLAGKTIVNASCSRIDRIGMTVLGEDSTGSKYTIRAEFPTPLEDVNGIRGAVTTICREAKAALEKKEIVAEPAAAEEKKPEPAAEEKAAEEAAPAEEKPAEAAAPAEEKPAEA